MSRMELFNQVTGVIFAHLLEAFPGKIDIDDRRIAEALGIAVEPTGKPDWNGEPGFRIADLPDGSALTEILWPTVRWLRDEGFITGDGETPLYEIGLTKTTLSILNSVPDSLRERVTLGDQVQSATKTTATEAGRSAIGEVVGQIIGAAAKAMST